MRIGRPDTPEMKKKPAALAVTGRSARRSGRRLRAAAERRDRSADERWTFERGQRFVVLRDIRSTRRRRRPSGGVGHVDDPFDRPLWYAPNDALSTKPLIPLQISSGLERCPALFRKTPCEAPNQSGPKLGLAFG